MQHYLILQYPYETVQIALCQNGNIIQEITEHKHNAVRAIIPNIQAILDQHNLKLTDIFCIGVNVGPGPYNTLRALLTMANGIHFAAQTPLINSSALQLLESEIQTNNSLVIFHAFLGHVFYRMKHDKKIDEGGCEITELIKIINAQKFSSPLLTVGNGAIMHKQMLLDECGKNLVFSEQIPAFNSVQTLAHATYEKLQKKDFAKNYAQPIYFDNISKK
ncbi:tRNA (adenosine(37)-N6)-threonylcarbamoyltransferase complex dimerization subunit type 1 TsaB [Candidatus Babeliales bacterium]|nr:tRNA (adenosine(37)-N6)-threonylcarbamoyltransferase complex dimerization subunit type 1 TsaB [Candidatus Babeliales bacterium]